MSTERFGLAEYIAVLQCERRLWRDGRPGAASELGAWLCERSRVPGALEALAPEAEAIDPELPIEGAAQATTRALGQGVSLLRGAAFQSGAWFGRADLVERVERGAVALHLLVADTAVREVDLDRAAFLAFLVEASERLAHVELWHLNREYLGGGPEGALATPHWPELIKRRDVTRDVRFLKSDVLARLVQVAPVRAADAEPAVEPSPHCWRPARCGFWDACTGALPAGAIAFLPRLRPEQFHALRERGIERIEEIPDDFPLLESVHRRACAAQRAGRAVVSDDLGERLQALGPSLAFLDFEAAVPGVPLLEGMAPLEPIGVQWSLLVRREQGKGSQAEFLAPAGSDPRPAFARSLCEALADWSGPIAVYSDFEAKLLARLEERCPEWAAPLARIRAQLADFLPLMRECVSHPGFRGSFSLKRVAPVLCESIRYDDLPGARSGAEAARILAAWVSGEVPESDQPRLADELLRYCRRDVEALQALHAALCALV